MENRKSRMQTMAVAAMLALVFGLSQPAPAQSPTFDSTTTVDQLKALAGRGNGDAILELGERLIQGQGVATNIDEGMRWLAKAADAGRREAWYDLGFVYSNGLIGGKPDIAEAMKYFQKGADLGNADCQTSMGLIYQAGEKIPGGVKADPAQAAGWYRKAAEQNHTEAIQHLAMLCMTGQGVTADPAEAAKWFRKGAELGNADCMWGLGQCYLGGKGIAQDSSMAFALFAVAVEGTTNPEQKAAMAARKDQLAKSLTADQLKKAESLMSEWKAGETH